MMMTVKKSCSCYTHLKIIKWQWVKETVFIKSVRFVPCLFTGHKFLLSNWSSVLTPDKQNLNLCSLRPNRWPFLHSHSATQIISLELLTYSIWVFKTAESLSEIYIFYYGLLTSLQHRLLFIHKSTQCNYLSTSLLKPTKIW